MMWREISALAVANSFFLYKKSSSLLLQGSVDYKHLQQKKKFLPISWAKMFPTDTQNYSIYVAHFPNQAIHPPKSEILWCN